MRLRAAPVVLLMPVLMLLGACATPRGADVASPAAADAKAPRPGAGETAASRQPAATPGRGGAYYLDDGPGENAPADLAAIPDAVPRAEPLLPRTLRPYSVFGRTYTPMTELAPYRVRGTASWYGRRYHGQPTSSGERYDMYAMTAAHPTLPIPSYVRVTRVADGRSVVVRVNDRGPFLHGRVIDLSYTAAAKLGFVAAGSAEVDVELITQFDEVPVVAARDAVSQPTALQAAQDAQPMTALQVTTELPNAMPQPAAPQPAVQQPAVQQPGGSGGERALRSLSVETTHAVPSDAPARVADAQPARGFFLQFGAFGSLASARSAMQSFARELAWIGAPFDVRADGALYKVQAGPFPRREHATAAAERVRSTTAHRPFAVFR